MLCFQHSTFCPAHPIAQWQHLLEVHMELLIMAMEVMSTSLSPCSDTRGFSSAFTKRSAKCKTNQLQHAYCYNAAYSPASAQHRHLLEKQTRANWTSHPSLPCSKSSSLLPCFTLLPNSCLDSKPLLQPAWSHYFCFLLHFPTVMKVM